MEGANLPVSYAGCFIQSPDYNSIQQPILLITAAMHSHSNMIMTKEKEASRLRFLKSNLILQQSASDIQAGIQLRQMSITSKMNYGGADQSASSRYTECRSAAGIQQGSIQQYFLMTVFRRFSGNLHCLSDVLL